MLDVLKKAAHQAGEIQMNYFRSTELDVAHKTSHQDIVTVADKKSQDVIQQTIISEMKKKGIAESDIGFIGEEGLSAEEAGLTSAGHHLFIIDPIDGTSNFASGIDYFCSSIAYVHDGVLTAGCIYRPTTEDIYSAQKGKGAFIQRKDKREALRVLSIDSQEQIVYTDVWESFDERHIAIVNTLMPQYRGVRINGAIALDIVSVADSIAGLCIVDTGPWIWDVAAAKIILEEAGGGLYDWKGNELTLDFTTRNKQYPIFACHPNKKELVMEHMQTY